MTLLEKTQTNTANIRIKTLNLISLVLIGLLFQACSSTPTEPESPTEASAPTTDEKVTQQDSKSTTSAPDSTVTGQQKEEAETSSSAAMADTAEKIKTEEASATARQSSMSADMADTSTKVESAATETTAKASQISQENPATPMPAKPEAAKPSTQEQTQPAMPEPTPSTTQAQIVTAAEATTSAAQSQAAETAQTETAALPQLKLPQRYGMWNLLKTSQGTCMITTGTIPVKEGDVGTQIWLQIEADQLIVNATLNLDIDPSTGLKFDGDSLIPFTDRPLPTRAAVKQDLSDQLKSASNMEIFLKGIEFSGTMLHKKVSLEGMQKAVTNLKRCAEQA